jgi:trk system potassium uptake protein TrkH
MRVMLVVAVIGRLLRLFALAFLPPLLLALVERSWLSAGSFAVAGLSAAALGTLVSWGYQPPRLFHRSEAMGVVAGTWLVVAAFAGMPYLFYGLSWDAALFEAMSGLTTTGATILEDFSLYDRPFFLWRAMTQWFGGLGVIALFVVVLPRLGIAGRQLFFAESSSAPGEGVSPQIRDSASKLWILYGALTALCAALLWGVGMTPYEAVVHAFTTMAAGGFSPNGESILGYHNARVEWVLIPFMFLAGASYPLQLKVFTLSDWRGFFKDEEFLFYTFVTVFGGLAVAAILTGGLPTVETVRDGLFQSASLISSTGFASKDYNLWSSSAHMVLILIMVVGGCAGSAAGGPKAIRHLLVARHIGREIKQVLHPRAVLPLRSKRRGVPDQVMRAVFTLAVLYIGGYFVFGVLLVWLGSAPITGFTASLACLGNVGPGLQAVGPMGNFAGFDAVGKVVLTFAMWIGRLEILSVLALLHPHVWRNLKWSR